MKLPQPLLPGHLLRRYQRFKADVLLEQGQVVTVHTPNTGSMAQCAVPGYPVLVSRSDNPQRKLAYTLELIQVAGQWVDTHTMRANKIVAEALARQQLPGVAGCQARSEVTWGDSRFDFMLQCGSQQVLLEVKNVTLMHEAGQAVFPDAPSLRGQRHLQTLAQAVAAGHRGIMLYLVQRSEARAFAPADHIDAAYGRLLRQAVAAGVEAWAYQTRVTPAEVTLQTPLPVEL